MRVCSVVSSRYLEASLFSPRLVPKRVAESRINRISLMLEGSKLQNQPNAVDCDFGEC